jgi:hypothetical protein
MLNQNQLSFLADLLSRTPFRKLLEKRLRKQDETSGLDTQNRFVGSPDERSLNEPDRSAHRYCGAVARSDGM